MAQIKGEAWSQAELSAAVIAYMDMLQHQEAGEAYSKAAYRRGLREGALSGRTEASIEYRFQNVSAALASLGLKTLQGYLPAKNVGTNVLKTLLKEVAAQGYLQLQDFQPTVDAQELEQRTAVIKDMVTSPPMGNRNPTATQTVSTTYPRDPAVKVWVLKRASGHCELCLSPAPFTTPKGEPFLEVHHIETLASGGPDTPDNCAALCPNCHRSLHHAENKEERLKALKTNSEKLNQEHLRKSL